MHNSNGKNNYVLLDCLIVCVCFVNKIVWKFSFIQNALLRFQSNMDRLVVQQVIQLSIGQLHQSFLNAETQHQQQQQPYQSVIQNQSQSIQNITPLKFNQSVHQQRSLTNQQTIKEILMKNKSMLNNLQKNLVQMKMFPEDPPVPPQPPPKAAGSNSANAKKLLKTILNRLELEHIDQMGKSVSKFARNSLELVKELGVIKDEMDMSSFIKADE